jgi:hypothetical protein
MTRCRQQAELIANKLYLTETCDGGKLTAQFRRLPVTRGIFLHLRARSHQLGPAR